MQQFNSETYKETFVLYKQNPEPTEPETLYYYEDQKSSGIDIVWMGTSIKDATSFNTLDDVVTAYMNAIKNSNEAVGVLLISTILNTIPTDSFAEKLHDNKVDDIFKKLEPEDISYLKETGILK